MYDLDWLADYVDLSSNMLEYRPVTPGVAGSSPVHSATI
ncbi:hypothetical protein PLIP_a1983 [Pseudoalteromonas lipolytica LMEB 39]|nr:hypothetical protein [Pseudoalteromonas lipolytica LMEB 39]